MIEICPGFLKNEPMKVYWFPLVAVVLVLVGCTPDRTLDTLIPRNALVVVLVDHPTLAVQALGSGEALPLRALETGKPWAAAVVPADPPGFLIAVALSADPTAWDTLERWARDRGGLNARRLGSYALLSSPGVPEPGALDPDRQFDLARVRAGGDPVALYVDVKNVVTEARFPDALRPAFRLFPWAEKNLSGIRMGFAPKDGGLEVRLATDWRPGSEAAAAFLGWSVPVDPATWAGHLPPEGASLVVSLPSAAWLRLAQTLPDPDLVSWASALAPLIGPRMAATLSPGHDTLSWNLALEAQDPLAVRQALRTLVAGGSVQRHFADWALDADTPLIYRDRPSPEGIRGTVTLGSSEVQVGYGSDRVVFSGGPEAKTGWDRWKAAVDRLPSWAGQVPPGATAVAVGSFDGLGAKGAFRVLGDGNAEVRVWVDAAGLQSWEERLPQAALGWLSGSG